MVHPLCLLDALEVSLARPHPDLLAAAQPVVANPHDGLETVVRVPDTGHLDHAPAPARLGEDDFGVMVQRVRRSVPPGELGPSPTSGSESTPAGPGTRRTRWVDLAADTPSRTTDRSTTGASAPLRAARPLCDRFLRTQPVSRAPTPHRAHSG